MKLFSIVFILIFLLPVNAQEKNYLVEYKDFYSARSSTSFLRFDMKSTKAGLITSSFF